MVDYNSFPLSEAFYQAEPDTLKVLTGEEAIYEDLVNLKSAVTQLNERVAKLEGKLNDKSRKG